MEQSGIYGRSRCSLAGLLMLNGMRTRRRKNPYNQILFCFMVIMFFASSVFSYSDTDEPLSVITETGPATPVLGQEWKVLLFVDYSEANKVSVKVPPLPIDTIRLDRVKTEPYVMYSGKNAGETWTLVEIFFVPLRAGPVILQPFEIVVPGRNAFTSQMVFQIETSEADRVYNPQLRWESVPEFIPENQTAELLLIMQNGNTQKLPADSLPVTIDIPKGVIMERIPLNPRDRSRNGILRLRIIPLEKGTVFFNPVTLEYNGMLLASPPLEIRVLPASANPVPSVPSYTLSEEELRYVLSGENIVSYNRKDDSPPYPAYLPVPLRKQYDEIIRKTEELWKAGKKVPAMAEIRKAERDLTVGFFLRQFRKELEQELELGVTNDETCLPVKLLFILCAVFFVLGIILFFRLFVLKRKKRVSFSFVLVFTYAAFVVFIIGAVVSGGLGAAALLKRSGTEAPRQAVLYSTNSYRVPEESGGISGSFKDGEPGIIQAAAGDWLYIETISGKSGWVPLNKVTRY